MSVVVEDSMLAELYCASCDQSFTTGARCPRCASKLVKLIAATDTVVAGELDGRFTVLSQLGRGGTGTVYRAKQHSVNREVALKVVDARRMSDPVVIKRFLREATQVSRLSHPNAVGVLDFGQTEEGVFYVVTELVNGATLEEELAGGPLAPARVAAIGTQICDALEAAHALRIAHRDLKASNVMIARDTVKVLDFGLATSLAAEEPAPADPRDDLYALGGILALLATGQPITSEAPSLLEGVPPSLAQVIEQLTALHPDIRYQTAAEARRALEIAAATLGLDGVLPAGPAPPPAPAPAPRSSRAVVTTETLAAAVRNRRRVWPYVVAGLLSAAVTAVVIGFVVNDTGGSTDAPNEPAAGPPTISDVSRTKRREPRPEDELAAPGAVRTVGNGTEGAVGAQSPGETKPVAPDETKPVPPPETKPVPPLETKPVAPPETKPVAPVVTAPVPPPETKPVAPPPPAKQIAPRVEPKPAPPPPPAKKVEVKKPVVEVPKKVAPPPPAKKPVRRVRPAPAPAKPAPAATPAPEPKLPF